MRSLALVLSAFATAALGADSIGRDAVGPRTVRLAYEARLTPPPGTERVELWLPLPREENQAVRELKLTGTGRVTVMRLPESADRVAWVRVEKPHEPKTLRLQLLSRANSAPFHSRPVQTFESRQSRRARNPQ